MSYNYDTTQVGVPYVRANKIIIVWPDNSGQPYVQVEQAHAVKLADGSIREFEKLPSMSVPLDLVNKGTESFPLVDPDSGADLGINSNLNTVWTITTRGHMKLVLIAFILLTGCSTLVKDCDPVVSLDKVLNKEEIYPRDFSDWRCTKKWF